ncbi:hypothetical protein [Algoriphagus namhaensis]
MAKASIEIIAALEKTAQNLETGAKYQWGHMGACNCGNLAQEITKLSKAEIHSYAMQRHGDWAEQILEFCPTSGYPMDLMIQKMIDFGFSPDDLRKLETLSDHQILAKMPKEKRDSLNKNRKSDVIYYMKTWALMLRDQWVLENPNLDLDEALSYQKTSDILV